jgi:hypothetical protein
LFDAIRYTCIIFIRRTVYRGQVSNLAKLHVEVQGSNQEETLS